MKITRDAERLCLEGEATIRDALATINATGERTCFLVNTDRVLLRVVTDGDIRRALLAGSSIDAPLSEVHDRDPIVVREGGNLEDARSYFGKRIGIAPLVDTGNHVTGVVRTHDLAPFIDIKSRNVLVLGLGYVGLTLGLVLADNGFLVHGYDVNQKLIDKLNRKELPFFEKGMVNFLAEHVGGNFKPSISLENVSADIYIITVGTPVDPQSKQPNTESIRAASTTIGRMLKPNDLVILRSTVPLGLTREFVLPILEQESGLKGGEDFLLAFCPERTAEGRALEELRKLPQIVGGIDTRSTELASRLFNENTHTVIDVGSLEAAEMCKLLDNTYRDTVFAYANTMAQLCEKAGLNMFELVEKVNIGYNRNAIPLPSPGVGGPCLSKDPYILKTAFQRYGLDCDVILAARKINETAPRAICNRATELLSGVGKSLKDAKVLIVGFAFKGEPETSDLRDSTTLWFLDELKRRGTTRIYGADPVVTAAEIEALGVTACSISDGFKGADAVFFMNNHRSYVNLPLIDLIGTLAKPAVFFDGWQVFSPNDLRKHAGVLYCGTGIG